MKAPGVMALALTLGGCACATDRANLDRLQRYDGDPALERADALANTPIRCDADRDCRPACFVLRMRRGRMCAELAAMSAGDAAVDRLSCAAGAYAAASAEPPDNVDPGALRAALAGEAMARLDLRDRVTEANARSAEDARIAALASRLDAAQGGAPYADFVRAYGEVEAAQLSADDNPTACTTLSRIAARLHARGIVPADLVSRRVRLDAAIASERGPSGRNCPNG